ncbi:MAG: hypothetical protein LQ340_002170 [Diploschistes diacapsis]|nr:MAG: hypothetical protein LQ340_002170 [Diploschistes diacapsis]
MSSGAETQPKRGSKAAGSGLDYLGIAVEICRYTDRSSTIDWQEIAKRAGSASVESVRTNWNKFKKNYEMVPMNSGTRPAKATKSQAKDDAVLKPKYGFPPYANATKVTKRKKASLKQKAKGKAEQEAADITNDMKEQIDAIFDEKNSEADLVVKEEVALDGPDDE